MSVYPARSTAPAPAPTSLPSPSTIWLGLDVHKESVTIAVLRGDAQAPDRVDRLPNDLPKLRRYPERLAGRVRSARSMKRAAPATCCTARARRGACRAT